MEGCLLSRNKDNKLAHTFQANDSALIHLVAGAKSGIFCVMTPFLIRWLVTMLAVFVVSQIPGIGVRAETTQGLILAGLFLGLLNAFVRPVLLLLSLPLILFSMGLFIFIVNAVLLYAVSGVVGDFKVDSFGSAILGSIVISLVSWFFSIFFRSSDGRVRVITHHPEVRREGGIKKVEGRVIE